MKSPSWIPSPPVSRETPRGYTELLVLGASGSLRVLASVRGMGSMSPLLNFTDFSLTPSTVPSLPTLGPA